jgi:hypothetical protein
MDLDAIALGEDFIEAIETTVAKCDVLIAVIGNNWLTSKDERGGRRLDNPDDFVRMEIGTALKRKIRVIPVLVDGALMPRADDLPEDLSPLVRRNALAITNTSFEGDCQRLMAAIRQVLEKGAAEQREKERLEAEQREKERLAAEQREKERLAAEQREKERLEAEQRENERPVAGKRQGHTGSQSEAIPVVSQPSQNFESSQAKTPSVLQSTGSTWQKPSVRAAAFAALVLIVIVGLMWFASRGGREAVPMTSTPMSKAAPAPTPATAPTPIEDYQSAIRDYDSRIASNNKDAEAYNLRGYEYFKLERYSN